jgi:hypothetical protein
MKTPTIESTRSLEVIAPYSIQRFNSVVQTHALIGFNP